MDDSIPENVYRGEMAAFPGPWAFQIDRSSLILVSDHELEALADPDAVLNLTLTFEKQEGSLRQVCERARAAGHRTLVLAFDHFFAQYRPGQAGPRRLTPDTDEYIRRIAAISRFAQDYGLGLELSLLSPLEIGPAYENRTGESGVWLHYRKGWLDENTGAYEVALWRQKRWTNNKGEIALRDAGVRVFAFREAALAGTSCRVVDPKTIVEISESAHSESLGESGGAVPADRVRIYGRDAAARGRNRVLVVQQYRTPEMDYFSDRALPFLTDLVDRYADAGVRLNGLYSDEMHIQQDWGYFEHHDNGQFALRYVSPGLQRRFAALYGDLYRDLAPWMVYFCYGQEDYARDLSARDGVSHVVGATPRAIRETALLRSRYYRLLQDGVVDLFARAKRHAERRMGQRLEARAHATWAESPTIDFWRTGSENRFRSAYEYTSNFVWSNTVHQAASACHDYFAWGDFLTGNGNDHAECGWADRNYVGLALACSTGIVNETPYSYAAHWGMPNELGHRRAALVAAYGAAGAPEFGMVQDLQHRDTDVLMLYPLDLVAVEERFGSWMTQYGYANVVTPAKLLERGRVEPGALVLGGRRFTTLAAVFEPFPSRRLLDLMRQFAESGGRLIWSGPPPVLTAEGEDALPAWRAIFGVDSAPDTNVGRLAPGQTIAFEGALAAVPPQVILTDFLVDHVYPVAPGDKTQIVACVKGQVVGTHRRLPGGGTATFLGFRPRDDQSASLGEESRTWFEVLRALGAYPGTNTWPGVNDNPDFLSRTSDYLVCRFPNGAVAVTPHFRRVEEDWPGGFARDEAEDRAYLERCPPPDEAIRLRDFRVNGHVVDYEGAHTVCFRVDEGGWLLAFAGQNCRQIIVDGHETIWADAPVAEIAWAPVAPERRVENGAVRQIRVRGTGTIRLPANDLPPRVALFAEGPAPGSRGEPVPSRRENNLLVFEATDALAGRWIWARGEAS